MSNQNLTNVHGALQDAIFEAQSQDDKMVPVTAKMNPRIKDLAEQICRSHHVTLSSFLRKCCEGLVRDYTDPVVEN